MSNKTSKIIIILTLVVTGVLISQILSLKFDYEFENFFPDDDPALEFYYEFKDKFSTDVDFVLVALRNESGIFDHEFLSKAKSLNDALKNVPRVERIISPFDAVNYALGPFGPIAIPFLHANDSTRYARDSANIYKYNREVGSLFSSDGKSISLVVEIEPNLSKLETDSVYIDMKAVIDQYSFDELHLAGKVIGQAYYIAQIKYEFALYFSLAVLLIVLILYLVYRSIWGVIIPLLIVLLAVIWLLGLMGITNKPIDIMTALLPLIIFVVGISDVIHLLSRYFEEIRAGKHKLSAIKTAYQQVGMATFLTSLTTAIGFLTLLTSGIRPVRELGVYAAIGVFIAFILAFTLLPAILSLSPVPKIAYNEPSNVIWNKWVKQIFRFSISRVKLILVSTVIFIGLSIYGISQIEIDNHLLEDVGEDDPMRYSFEYFEENFAGARPFEMHLLVKDSTKNIFDIASVREMEKIETYLRESYGVGFLLSPLSIIRSANQALNGGHHNAYTIPESNDSLKKAIKLAKTIMKRPEFSALLANNAREARISGKMTDLGGKRTKALNTTLNQYFEHEVKLDVLEYRLTGMALLIDQNNETLSKDMMYGLIGAIALVAIIMGFIFKSITMTLITLVPNVLPLLAIGGFMGWMDMDLKVSTSIIFGIAFGIAVDDSIHYLSKYRQELLKGRRNIWAIRRASLSTGKAIILTSLILCAGFMLLSTSDFTSTHYVGLLVSITLAVAVVADLFLLPLLLLAKRKW